MRTCYQTLRHELKSVVVHAPQAEERRGKYTWRAISFFQSRFAAAPLVLLCLDYFAPQAEERRGETREMASQRLYRKSKCATQGWTQNLAPRAEKRRGKSRWRPLLSFWDSPKGT